MNEKTVKKLVVLSILLTDTGNILDKSPDYIYEKAKVLFHEPGPIREDLLDLDDGNLSRYKKYCEKWMI